MQLDVQGDKYVPGDKDYWAHAYQYATSSHINDMDMRPGMVLYPAGDADVQAAIKYAEHHKIAIAVRSGGHQYCGASSTGAKNILLDMKHAYHDGEKDFVHTVIPADKSATGREKHIVQVGVSFQLWDVNQKLASLQLFVPHGQCSHVHVGGHAHTGGYGQLSRAFGLFADHIIKIRIITADAKIREIARDSTHKDDIDLFWAVLGGSPGNYAVLTHVWLDVYHDSWFPDARGLKLVVPLGYQTEKNLVDLLHIVADMACDEELPADFDYCVSVVSGGNVSSSPEGNQVAEKWGLDVEGMDNLMHQHYKQVFGNSHIATTKRGNFHTIIIYAQWANLKGAAEKYEDSAAPAWFEKIWKAVGKASFTVTTGPGTTVQVPYFVAEDTTASGQKFTVNNDRHLPLSILTGQWVMKDVREFDCPYIKRTYCTDWTTQLKKADWAEFTADQLYARSYDPTDGCRIVSQIQPFNGKYSRFATKDPENKTSYSWRRELSVVSVMDCFYDPNDAEAKAAGRNPRDIAKLWQHTNDVMHIESRNPIFCDRDIRVLWGSHASKPEEYNMGVAWPFYHESLHKYQRLVAIKRRFDPHNVFTPNVFCVGVDPSLRPAKPQGAAANPAVGVEGVDSKFAAAARKRAADHQLVSA